MAQPSNSLFRRIRSVKSSLDNAEQSFLDNKDIREAELKNLRQKKDVPWSWNRQVLAASAAMLLVLAGVGGWYFARDHYKQRAKAPVPPVAKSTAVQAEPQVVAPAIKQQPTTNTRTSSEAVLSQAKDKEKEKQQSQLSISKADLHKLVQSARVELSNSK